MESDVIERKKPGPAPKPQVDVQALSDRVHNLEQLVLRMAHQSGTSHQIITHSGLTPFNPSKNDMTKFRRGSNG